MSFDKDGYPTERTLKAIAACNIAADFTKLGYLIQYLYDHWRYPFFFIYNKENGCLEISTGGWSGNESIIEALGKSSFWWIFWAKSVRGGHYWFELFDFDENGKRRVPPINLKGEGDKWK